MTLLLTRKARLCDRIRHLPVATHNCEVYGIWIRRPRSTGKLQCKVCGRP
jgi:hypothetical protein